MSTTRPTYYALMSDIKKRLGSTFPIKLTVPDPISSHEITLDRNDIYASLIVKADQLIVDGQTVAVLFAEFARFHRACERAAMDAERAFVAWKASIAGKYRDAHKERGSVKDSENAYRTHAEYEQRAGMSSYYKTLAELFSDLKDAMRLKGRMVEMMAQSVRGYEGASKVAQLEADAELEELDAMVERSVEDSRKPAVAKGPPIAFTAPPLPPPEDDEIPEEEGEEALSFDDEDEESDDQTTASGPAPSEDDDEEEEAAVEVVAEKSRKRAPAKAKAEKKVKTKSAPVVVEDDEEEDDDDESEDEESDDESEAEDDPPFPGGDDDEEEDEQPRKPRRRPAVASSGRSKK